MIMNAVLAVALGLAPVKPGLDTQVIQYNPTDFADRPPRNHAPHRL